MKFSNILISFFLAFSLNCNSYAEEHTKTECVKENVPMQQTTTANITYKKIVPIDTNLGKLYEDYMNQIKALPAAGNFKNFKIGSHSFSIYSEFRMSESTEVTITASIIFDLNYKAITELTKLNRTDLYVMTNKYKICS
jgi:hypothetical protein